MKVRLFQNATPDSNNLPRWALFLPKGLVCLRWTNGLLSVESTERSNLSDLTLGVMYLEGAEFEIDCPTVDRIVSAHSELQEISRDIERQLGHEKAAEAALLLESTGS